ncbi:hypothetical protein [Pseudoalteromonas luteoviolacea]|nr:hypothetical protein [Pseudoalteromonas luteoviolacea]
MNILIKKYFLGLCRVHKPLKSLEKSTLKFVSGGTNGGGIDPQPE